MAIMVITPGIMGVMPDCGACAQCAGGGALGVQRLCVKKVCRNKVWTKN